MRKKHSKLQVHHSNLNKCFCCHGTLYTKKEHRSIVKATVFNSEKIWAAATQSKVCWRCKVYYRHNFVWLGGQKINCMSFNQMLSSGLYFVTSKTAFTMSYLELCYYRLLRAKTAPGQEAAVRHLVHGNSDNMFWGHHSLRDHLLRALEGYAVAKRTPHQVVPYNLDFPAKEIVKLHNPLLLFPPTKVVQEVACDGHFGVHRPLHACEPRRTVAKKGRPMKIIADYERSCHCKKKDAVRQVLPDRTAGWQFALDPRSGKVLGAYEHIVNERNEDKVALLQKVLALKNMKVDLLLHDDACHLEKFITTNHSQTFADIKLYLVDAFHMKNHKCSKCKRTRKEKKRLKGISTSVCETFNAWLRPLNFFLNSLRPHSHKFWVEESCIFYNNVLQSLPRIITRRTTAQSRKKIQKKK